MKYRKIMKACEENNENASSGGSTKDEIEKQANTLMREVFDGDKKIWGAGGSAY